MIEDDVLPRDLRFARPVPALRQVSYDLTLRRPLELADGSTITALEVQWELLDRARKYAEAEGLAVVGEEVGADVLRRWEAVLTGLETDPMALADQLDWVAKYRLFDAYRERHGLDWDDARLAAMDLQYHDLRPEKSLFARLGLERLIDDDEVESGDHRAARRTPGPTSGARACSEWADAIVAANWDSLVFDVGSDPLRRVPMMEPLTRNAKRTWVPCWRSARRRPSCSTDSGPRRRG